MMMFRGIDNRGLIKQFFILIFMLIIVGIGIWLWSEIKNPITQIKENSLLSKILQETQQAMNEEFLSLKLFFASRDQSLLVIEDREVKMGETSIHQQIRQALLELIKGPYTDLVRTVSPDTKLRSFYIDKHSVGYIDFSSELVQNCPGGSWAEVLTVYSIVNTITQNFPQIHKIKLLINGEEIETLRGHLDMQRAFSFNELLSYPQSFF